MENMVSIFKNRQQRNLEAKTQRFVNNKKKVHLTVLPNIRYYRTVQIVPSKYVWDEEINNWKFVPSKKIEHYLPCNQH